MFKFLLFIIIIREQVESTHRVLTISQSWDLFPGRMSLRDSASAAEGITPAGSQGLDAVPLQTQHGGYTRLGVLPEAEAEAAGQHSARAPHRTRG